MIQISPIVKISFLSFISFILLGCSLFQSRPNPLEPSSASISSSTEIEVVNTHSEINEVDTFLETSAEVSDSSMDIETLKNVDGLQAALNLADNVLPPPIEGESYHSDRCKALQNYPSNQENSSSAESLFSKCMDIVQQVSEGKALIEQAMEAKTLEECKVKYKEGTAARQICENNAPRPVGQTDEP